MFECEGGTKGRHRVSQTRLVQGDSIELALDDKDRLRAADGFPVDIKGKERLPFLEQRRIRRIQIFGYPVAKYAATESDNALTEVGDAEHDSGTEAVVIAGSVVPRDYQAGCSHVLLGVSLHAKPPD